jgi:hypothetical protein
VLRAVVGPDESSRRTTSRSFQLTPALIGLVGVLIGALTTSGIAYLGAQRRRDDDKRAAVRLVTVEVNGDERALFARLAVTSLGATVSASFGHKPPTSAAC